MASYIEIKEYTIRHYAGGSNEVGYGYRVIMSLIGNNNTAIGAVFFHRTKDTMPAADSKSASNYVSMHYTMDEYPQIVDLLRNEAPLYLNFVEGNFNFGSISTSKEPVGENELH